MILAILLSLSPMTPPKPITPILLQEVIKDSDYDKFIKIIVTNMKDNKCAVLFGDSDFDGDFSLDFMKLIMDICKYFQDQGFKVTLYHIDKPNIIKFVVSKVVV